MAVFVWTGRTRQGAVQRGEIEAKTREEATARLRAQQIVLTSIAPKGGGFALKLSFGGGKVTAKDISVFTRQFSTMINSGLPLVQCLSILAGQAENKVFGKALDAIRQEVEGGSTLAAALKKHPKVFDELYVNLVMAGEAAGILDTILGRLAKHIEKAEKLKGEVKSAMVYPTIIVVVAVVVIGVLMVFVIPIFAQMFTGLGGVLPLPTRIVMGMSYFLQRYIILIILAGVGAAYGVKRYYRTDKGRLTLDQLFLKLPIIGDLIRKASVAKFTRTLGTLMTSGVPILEGMTIVAKTSGNRVIERAIMTARQSISEGKTVAEPLGKSKVFPPMVIQMINVGEATGQLDAMLGKIADFYDEEVEAAVAALTAALEPMLMVFLGVTVGFIVIAMYLPIFQMASLVG